MKKVKIILFSVQTAAFTIGSVLLYNDGNSAAGTMGLIAAVVSVVALVLELKRPADK